MINNKKEKTTRNVEIREIVKTTCYSKPPKKASCKMIESDNLSELINLLQNEAKVI